MTHAALKARIEAKLASGEMLAALALLEKEEEAHPLDARLQHLFERVYLALGDPVAAAASHLAALALEEREPLLLYNLATGYFLHGQSKPAEKWYRVTLLADPDMAMAHQNLASILRDRGETASADEHLHLAYTRQWLFHEETPTAQLTVLMTCAAGIGNVPTRYLVPAESCNIIKCMVEYADLSAIKLLPHDLIFNVVGDPDSAAASDPRLSEILSRSSAPVINRPSQIDATRRDRLSQRLDGIEHVVVPTTMRITSDDIPSADELFAAVGCKGASIIILRPVKSHGGKGVELATTGADVERFFAHLGQENRAFAAYATAFHDSRDAIGRYRKYRVIFVDGVPYPYHLAISSHWLVHYFSAQMEGNASSLAEELEFLKDPLRAIGDVAWGAIKEIGKQLDLGYAGVDFTVLDDGKVLVFEANATMLVHPEPEDGPSAYKNPFITTIIEAFSDLLKRKARLTQD